MKQLYLIVLALFVCGFVSAQDSVNITFNVDMSSETVDPGGVYLAGGGTFGNPGDNEMTDPDGDGVYSITVRLPEKIFTFYTHTNGNCPNYSCKEDLAGKPCGDPANFNDRSLGPVAADTTVTTCFGECVASCPPQIDVTFRVNTSMITVDTMGMFVFGNFANNFGTQFPMTNAGNDIWEYTTTVTPGTFEYKFLNGMNNDEMFDPATGDSACTNTSGPFTNRVVTIQGTPTDTVLDAYFFAECSIGNPAPPAADSVTITFNVNMENETVDPAGVFLAGGGIFGVPGDNEMTDPDGDGIYSITVRFPEGQSGFYKFANGACADFSCAEDLTGKPCGDPGNFNDRSFGPVAADTTISTCFGECTDDGSCPAVVPDVNVTFRVATSNITVDTAGMFIFGNFDNNFGTQFPMTDLGNGIWEYTATVPAAVYEYKFLNGMNNDEIFDPATDDSVCTVTTGQFTNRVVTIPSGITDTVLNAYLFASCDIAPSSIDGLNRFEFSLVPNPAATRVTLRFENAVPRTIQLFDAVGKTLIETQTRTAQTEVSLTEIPAGVYFVRVQEGNRTGIQKVVVVK